jgi:HSP20 family protein
MSDTALEKRQTETVNVPAERVAEWATQFTPLVDVIETGEEYVFQADLPGVKASDVDVSYENGTLTIAGKVQPRQPRRQGYVWQEYALGHFYRQFSLPQGTINPDGIRAGLKDGVLELHVPKADTAKARKIQIRSA